MNKKVKGQQWWFASPPPGWVPSSLPYRCPVEGCERTGGLPDLLNLWRHIMQKHPGEVELYQGVLTAIKAKLEQAVPADLQKLLDTGPVLSEEDLDVANADLPTEPAVAPETFGTPYACGDCDWKPKAGAKQPRAALLMHRRHKHEGGD
jgi:hypothetical protein